MSHSMFVAQPFLCVLVHCTKQWLLPEACALQGQLNPAQIIGERGIIVMLIFSLFPGAHWLWGLVLSTAGDI